MYTVEVVVQGTAPLIQHRYSMMDPAVAAKGGKKSTGAKNYADEWKEHLYVNKDNQVFQPASHFEGALTKAAANFKVTGKRGKTYKDLFVANVVVEPLEILHGVERPETLDYDADNRLYLDARPVVQMRTRILRIRPVFKTGWILAFTISVLDDELPFEILNDALILAGKAVGVGDYRPKFGRFMVTRFELVK